MEAKPSVDHAAIALIVSTALSDVGCSKSQYWILHSVFLTFQLLQYHNVFTWIPIIAHESKSTIKERAVAV